MSFYFTELQIPGVIIINHDRYFDVRGHFFESYKKSEFKKNGITENFVQDNISFSKKHVLRGLHFQTNPFAQGKLVQVISGYVIDYMVDLRSDSPTYKKWLGVDLNDVNDCMIYIPPGLAHGFLSLKPTIFSYKCTAEYSAENDGGIIWNDPDINIKYKINSPIVSEKDKNLPYLKDIL